MYKKTITYTNFDDIKVTEDFYFNLTEAELRNLELTTPGGYSAYLERIIGAVDVPGVIKVLNDVIRMSYGIKSADGKFFRKSEEISDDFFSCAAYDSLMAEMWSEDPDESVKAIADFVTSIMPLKYRSDITKALADNGVNVE